MKAASLSLLLTLGVAACSSPTPDKRGRVKVVGVADGDTITVLSNSGKDKSERIRLYGIDCPERAQPYGTKAREFTSDMVLGKLVAVERIGAEKDRYGRTVAKVWLDKLELGQKLLANGLAWHATRHDSSPQYAELERMARKARHGLWSEQDPVPPWKWRVEQRDNKPHREAAPSTGPFHGNVKSKALHSRTCRNYDCKNCTEVFATTAAAKQQGYRPHNCVKE